MAKPITTPRNQTARQSGINDLQRHYFALRLGGAVLRLPEGDSVIGRGAGCQFALDDPLVSRAHALISVTGNMLSITDLGSRNGVLVNGKRVVNSFRLEEGDLIRVGSTELWVERREHDPGRSSTGTGDAKHGAARSPRREDDEVTGAGHALTLLAPSVEKSLALGRLDEAVHLVEPHLYRVLAQLQEGLVVAPDVADVAARLLGMLAEATRDGRWVDFAVRVFRFQARPLPVSFIERLYRIHSVLEDLDRLRFREYVAFLRSRAPALEPGERFALQRLEGLLGMDPF